MFHYSRKTTNYDLEVSLVLPSLFHNRDEFGLIFRSPGLPKPDDFESELENFFAIRARPQPSPMPKMYTKKQCMIFKSFFKCGISILKTSYTKITVKCKF